MSTLVVITWVTIAVVFGIGLFCLYHAIRLKGRVGRINDAASSAMKAEDIANAIQPARRMLVAYGSFCVVTAIALGALLIAGPIHAVVAVSVAVVVSVFGAFVLSLFEDGNFNKYAWRIYDSHLTSFSSRDDIA